MLALLDGRFNVAFKEIKRLALPVLRHRVILNFEAEAEGFTTDTLIKGILEAVRQAAE